MRPGLLLLIPAAVLCVDNGLGLTPPLGWRSFNAFWGIIDQIKMETNMDAMVNRSRKVVGKPSSLSRTGLVTRGSLAREKKGVIGATFD